jgi:hypothetical protein
MTHLQGLKMSLINACGPLRASLILALALVSPALAQDTSRVASPDSLLARLKALEASVEVLQKQVAEAATGGVHTRNRFDVELTGRVVMNAFTNERIVNNVDDPQFVRPDSSSLVPLGGFGMAIRQTMLGLRTNVSDVLGGSFHGVIDVDFYGGQQPSSGGRTFPLLRLRTAHGTLRWAHGELLAGQEIPLFSPLNPITPAAMGTPGFVTAGNLWLWLPQLRGTIEAGSTVKVALQAAVLAPTSGDPVATFDTDFDAAERTRLPYLESRVRVRWGEFEMASEVGCAGHLGRFATAAASRVDPDSSLQSFGFSCDAKLPIASWLELRGEAYTGRLLRGLGGGAISQGIIAGRGVRNVAGWGQVNLHTPANDLAGGVGCGADAPLSQDVAPDPAARRRNTTCAAYSIVRPGGPVFLGIEARRTATQYLARRFDNNHFNLAVGFEF